MLEKRAEKGTRGVCVGGAGEGSEACSGHGEGRETTKRGRRATVRQVTGRRRERAGGRPKGRNKGTGRSDGHVGRRKKRGKGNTLTNEQWIKTKRAKGRRERKNARVGKWTAARSSEAGSPPPVPPVLGRRVHPLPGCASAGGVCPPQGRASELAGRRPLEGRGSRQAPPGCRSFADRALPTPAPCPARHLPVVPPRLRY